jgi:uncharacterized repeat protein (TIGR01451 family)
MRSRGVESRAVLGAGALALLSSPAVARADEPVVLRQAWSGHVAFFATGAAMAIDGPDGDTNVDTLVQPASVDVAAPDVPALGMVRAAFLYWGGSIVQSDCFNPNAIDDTVDFTPPGGVTTTVVADACFCSDAGALAYDVQACRADVTSLVTAISGTYTVDGFSALIANASTHNASFSVVLVYEDPLLPPRRVALYDGLLTMAAGVNAEEIITLDGLDVDDPPSGDLTWYVLEGDVGGSAGESAQATGFPGGTMLPLTDAYNPVDNPMNHTITTTDPPQTDVIGVDVDRFSIDGALAAGDTAVQVRYTAGLDKWWLVYDVVGVNVYEPVLADSSAKTWVLHDDGDGDGVPSPGDVIRYTIHLENTGNADGVVAVSDPIAPQAAGFTLVDAGGGVDQSAGTTVHVVDIPLGVGDTADVVIDVVLDDVPSGTTMSNVAEYTAAPGGVHGFLVAPLVVVENAGGGSASDTGGATTGSTGAPETTGTTGAGADAVDETGGASTSGAESGGGNDRGTTTISGASTGAIGDDSTGASTPTPHAETGDADGCSCTSTAPPRRAFPWLVLLAAVRWRSRGASTARPRQHQARAGQPEAIPVREQHVRAMQRSRTLIEHEPHGDPQGEAVEHEQAERLGPPERERREHPSVGEQGQPHREQRGEGVARAP